MGNADKLDTAAALKVLDSWKMSDDDGELEVLGELTERSLKEVKALTEYEDSKAQRILVAIAFLAALSGTLFSVAGRSLLDAHAIAGIFRFELPVNWLAIGVFGGFALYALSLAIGAICVLSAVRPKFNIPSHWAAKDQKTFPPSFLFFREILKVRPEQWVEAYVSRDSKALLREYIKNSVIETYLVADKIRIKLQPLETGVMILLWSTVVLAIWLPIAILAIAVPNLGL
jgi:hypothetical protein